VIGVEALLGQKVLSVEERHLEDPQDDRSHQDCDEVYSDVLNTAQGRCEIIYRNSSNGYYGGWVEPGYGVSEIPAGAEEITEDKSW